MNKATENYSLFPKQKKPETENIDIINSDVIETIKTDLLDSLKTHNYPLPKIKSSNPRQKVPVEVYHSYELLYINGILDKKSNIRYYPRVEDIHKEIKKDYDISLPYLKTYAWKNKWADRKKQKIEQLEQLNLSEIESLYYNESIKAQLRLISINEQLMSIIEDRLEQNKDNSEEHPLSFRELQSLTTSINNISSTIDKCYAIIYRQREKAKEEKNLTHIKTIDISQNSPILNTLEKDYKELEKLNKELENRKNIHINV